MVHLKIKYIDLRAESNQERLTELDMDAINDLLAELSSKAPTINKETILSTLRGSHIVVAYVGDKIVGMGSLILIQQLTGYFARIEDVVVNSKVRNLGIGRGILEKLLEISVELGVSRVDLSSRPERAAANKLYESLGFARRDTHVYRLEF